jgi:hypothetical protein
MLSKIIRERIQQKFGQEIRYSKDCEVLAVDICNNTSRKISVSTIKRLFGLAKGIEEPRLYTLDVLAIYIGYKNYDDLLIEFKTANSSELEILEEVRAESLNMNDELDLQYEPNRNLKLRYLGDSKFELIEVLNSKLKEKDIVVLSHIIRDYPLFLRNVIRKEKNLGSFTAAKISGITSIRILTNGHSHK